MRMFAFQAVIAALMLGAPVSAQDAPASIPAATAPVVVKVGDMIRTADGRLVGPVDKVQFRDGKPLNVTLIFNQRFVRIPASTLSTSKNGVMTQLTRKELVQSN